ncbi:MAG: SMC-Scp complex subunit ScpB [Phycisphaerales bacterium]|nr:SMC-Scp complex subunit ScpB [Phycisphaerales bacterium]
MDRDEYPAKCPTGEPATEVTTPMSFEGPAHEVGISPANSAQAESAPVTETMLAVSPANAAPEIEPAQVLEALLFSSDAPVTAGRLAELLGTGSPKEVRRLIAELNEKYAAAALSFRIEEIAKGFQMLTLAEYRPWVAKLTKQQAQTRLGAAALEALSIVAYKQPIIRADIEAIRGVACGEVLNRLREMGLIKIVGRAEIVGRPLLYGTTKRFLDVFGLADLNDLPPMEALTLGKTAARAEPETEAAATPRVAAAGA